MENEPKSAMRMTDAQYRSARQVAMAGKLPPMTAAPAPAAADAAPPEATTSSSATQAAPATPDHTAPRSALAMTDAEYASARRHAIGGTTARSFV